MFSLEDMIFPWFLGLFCNTLPLELLLRTWDCFFHEGVKALHRIAIAICALRESDLMSLDDDEVGTCRLD